MGQHIRNWLLLCSMLFSSQLFAVTYVPIQVGDINVIIPIDDPPVAQADSFSLQEDTPTTLDVLANDTDEKMDAIVVNVVQSTSNGTLVPGSDNKTLTYKPAQDFHGADSFTYNLTDEEQKTSETVTVTIQVNPVNDAPIVTSDSYEISEDAALTHFTLLNNDTDVDSTVLTLEIVETNSVASFADRTLTLSSDAKSVNYQAPTNVNGVDWFTYKVSDDVGGVSNVVRVSVTINPQNDLPVASNINAVTDEDNAVLITPSGADIDGDNLTFAAASPPAYGTVTMSQGQFLYTPNANFYGSDSFTYVANDGRVDSAPAQINLLVNSVNDAPQVLQAVTNLSINEDSPQIINILEAVSDADNDALYIDSMSVNIGALEAYNRTEFIYKPPAHYNSVQQPGDNIIANILVSDGAEFVSLQWHIDVQPVKDVPEVDFFVLFGAEQGTLIVRAAVTDEDGITAGAPWYRVTTSNGIFTGQFSTWEGYSGERDQILKYSEVFEDLVRGNLHINVRVKEPGPDNNSEDDDTWYSVSKDIFFESGVEPVNRSPVAVDDTEAELGFGVSGFDKPLPVMVNDSDDNGEIHLHSASVDRVLNAEGIEIPERAGRVALKMSSNGKRLTATTDICFEGKIEGSYSIVDQHGALGSATIEYSSYIYDTEAADAPENLTVSPELLDWSSSNNSALLRWSPVFTAGSSNYADHNYKILVRDENDDGFVIPSITADAYDSATGKFKYDLVLDKPGQYYAYVASCIPGTFNCGCYGNEVAINAYSTSIENFKAQNTHIDNGDDVMLQWDPSGELAEYELQTKRPNSSSWSNVLFEGQSRTSEINFIETLTSTGKHQYRVRACFNGDPISGCGNYSPVIEVQVRSNQAQPETPPAAPEIAKAPEIPNYDVGFTAGQFRVDESGSATYSVPFSLPSGIAGLTPSLGLSYSSAGGNGPVGIGWNISGLSQVSRCRRTIEQDGVAGHIEFDANDRFCLDGQKLIQTATGEGFVEYRTEIDNKVRVRAYGVNLHDPDYFTVEREDGSTSYYGSPELGAAPSVMPVVTVSQGKLSWLLARISDNMAKATNVPSNFDNHIVFNYSNTSGSEILPANVSYGGNTVTFNWGERSDKQTYYSHGAQFTVNQRLNNVEVSNHKGEKVRLYEVTYDSAYSNIVSRVTKIQEFGYTDLGGQAVARAATLFDWQDIPKALSVDEVEATEKTVSDFGNDTIILSYPLDVNADGFVDLIAMTAQENNYHVYYAQNTAGTLQSADHLFSFNYEVSEYNPVQLIPADIDADGHMEFIYPTNTGWHHRGVDDSGPTFIRSNSDKVRNVRLHDVNADARPDFLYELMEDEVYQESTYEMPAHKIMLNNGGNFGTQLGIAQLPRDLWGVGADFLANEIFNESQCQTLGALNLSPMRNMPIADFDADGIADTVMRAKISVECGVLSADENIQSLSANKRYFLEFLVTAALRKDGENYRYQDFTTLAESFSQLIAEESSTEINYDATTVADLNRDGLSDLLYFSREQKTKLYVKYGGQTATVVIDDIAENFDDVHGLQVMDVNKDLRPDIIYFSSLNLAEGWHMLVQNTGADFRSCKNKDTAKVFRPCRHVLAAPSTYEKDDIPAIADWNGDGEPGFGVMDVSANQLTYYGDLYEDATSLNSLDTITNGYGLTTEIKYSQLTDSDIYTKGSNSGTLDAIELATLGSPVFDLVNPSFVVSSVKSQVPGSQKSAGTYKDVTGDDAYLSVNYQYEGLRAQAGGRGLLGFAKITTTDDREVVSSTEYRQDFPFTGMPVKTIQTRHSVQMSWAENEYQLKILNPTANGGRGTYFPYLSRSLEKQYGLTGDNNNWVNTATQLTVNDYQIYHTANHVNLDVVDVYHFEGVNFDSDSLADMQSIPPSSFLHVNTVNVYTDDTANWRLGRLTNATVTHERKNSGAPTNVHVRNSAFTYHANTGLLETETVAANSTDEKLNLTTRHCYDDFGNKIGTVAYSKNFTPTSCTESLPQDLTGYQVYRQQIISYDDEGRYIISTQNGGITTRTIAVTDYSRYGSPEVVKNADDQAVKTWYDAFGNPIATSDSTGARQLTERALKEQLSEPNPGVTYHIVEKVSSSGTTGTKQVAPTEYRYFDKLGRQVATARAGFAAGDYYISVRHYDLYGRTLFATEPFVMRGGSYGLVRGSEYEYDWTGRATSVTSASGASSSMSYTNGGLTTTTTVNFLDHEKNTQAGQIRKEIRNILGETTQVLENENVGGADATAVSYVYYPTGELYQAGPEGAKVTTEFDAYGRKTEMNDPDKGVWTYSYNALGELVTQSKMAGDNTAVKTSFIRDAAGRTTRRKEEANGATETTLYQYHTGEHAHRLKKVCFAGATADSCDNSRPYRSYGYDSLGRQNQMTYTIGSESVISKTTFDEFGRVFQQFDDYEEKRGIRAHFNDNGYRFLEEEARYSGSASDRLVYSEIAAMNARGQATDIRSNNGTLRTQQAFNSRTGLMRESLTTNGHVQIQHNQYQYDQLGNFKKRWRHSLQATQAHITYQADGSAGETTINAWMQEFDYDRLNRLTHIKRLKADNTRETQTEEWARYDTRGNITWKKDLGHYCYSSGRPHAVSSIQSSSCTGNQAATFAYDSWGNMTSGRDRTVDYTSFDKAEKISKDGKSTWFNYDSGRNRYERITDIDAKEGSTATQERTLYFGGVERIYENTGANGAWVHTVTRRNLGGVLQTVAHNGNETTQFLHKDNLGSINTITDENNRILQKLYFDPWGKKHLLPEYMWSAGARAHQAATLAGLLDITPRGFTGHEHVDHADIIHMNGRIYDPTLGRFLQADPFIQAPGNSQSYNRYSYLMNNPLSGTDPTGYIGSFFRKIVGAITNGIVGELIARVIPQARILLQAAACFYGGPIGCAASSFGNTIASGGSLKGAFTNSAFAYASSEIFSNIGEAFNGTSLEGGLLHIGSHAVAGGVLSDLQGGKFGHGFFSAGLTKAANVNGIFSKFGEGWDAVRTITAAVIGGTISNITGGKFANGAATAAFAQHFNGNSAIEDPDIGGYSPASGYYPTDNGGRLEYLEVKAGSALLTDQTGNSYGFNPENGTATFMFEAGNGGATSVAPEAYLMGGLGIGRSIVAAGYKVIAYVTGRGAPTYANFARGANARNLWKTITFGRAFRSYQRPASFYWNKAGGNFGNAVNSLGRSNAMYNRALIPFGAVGATGVAINNYE